MHPPVVIVNHWRGIPSALHGNMLAMNERWAPHQRERVPLTTDDSGREFEAATADAWPRMREQHIKTVCVSASAHATTSSSDVAMVHDTDTNVVAEATKMLERSMFMCVNLCGAPVTPPALTDARSFDDRLLPPPSARSSLASRHAYVARLRSALHVLLWTTSIAQLVDRVRRLDGIVVVTSTHAFTLDEGGGAAPHTFWCSSRRPARDATFRAVQTLRDLVNNVLDISECSSAPRPYCVRAAQDDIRVTCVLRGHTYACTGTFDRLDRVFDIDVDAFEVDDLTPHVRHIHDELTSVYLEAVARAIEEHPHLHQHHHAWTTTEFVPKAHVDDHHRHLRELRHVSSVHDEDQGSLRSISPTSTRASTPPHLRGGDSGTIDREHKRIRQRRPPPHPSIVDVHKLQAPKRKKRNGPRIEPKEARGPEDDDTTSTTAAAAPHTELMPVVAATPTTSPPPPVTRADHASSSTERQVQKDPRTEAAVVISLPLSAAPARIQEEEEAMQLLGEQKDVTSSRHTVNTAAVRRANVRMMERRMHMRHR